MTSHTLESLESRTLFSASLGARPIADLADVSQSYLFGDTAYYVSPSRVTLVE